MSGDRTGENAVLASLSEATLAWLEERSADLGVSREELLRGIVAGARAVDEDEVVPATRDDLAAVREAVADLDDDTDRKIDDVRERVVQVKREADAKAPADHDHPALAERVAAADEGAEALAGELATVRETAGDLRADLGDLEATVADLASDVEGGFENYEEVLEYLADERDRLADEVDAVSDAVADIRRDVRSVAGEVASAAGVEDLREEANRHGVRTAACEDCGSEVDVALLTRPTCPHCAASFAEVEPRQGFLGTHTLVTGEVPALTVGDDRTGDFEFDTAAADGGGGTTGAEPDPGTAVESTPEEADPGAPDDSATDATDSLDPFGDDD